MAANIEGIENLVRNVVAPIITRLPTPLTRQEISDLIAECTQTTAFDIARTIEICTVIPKTQSIRPDIETPDVLNLNLAGREALSDLDRQRIRTDLVLNRRHIVDFVLNYLDVLYENKRPNPNVFDYLVIQDYNEVVFCARLREVEAGYSLFFEINRIRSNIEEKIRSEVYALRVQRARQAVSTQGDTRLLALVGVLALLLVSALAVPPIARALK